MMANSKGLTPHIHRTSAFRPQLLQGAFLGAFGMMLPEAFAAPREKGPKAKNVILVWMPGGPPQMHLWDLKPDSPAQCRGTSTPIATSVPGMRFGHWLPQ